MSEPDMRGQVASDQLGLHDLLLDRLARSALSDEAQLIVLAAIEGEAALADYIADPEKISDAVQPEVATTATPARAYLAEIKAQSFRGIGRAASVSVNPAPGLVLVVGRNGSGKSSFAEAAEIALTGVNARWIDKSEAMREGWRNLHNNAAPEVDVQLHVDGDRGSTAVHRSWPGDDVRKSDCWVQRPGERRMGLANLGWDGALKTHRPFLSYAELGQLISGRPSEAYDALESILGLDRLATAEKYLRAAQRLLNEEARRVDVALEAMLTDLQECDDPRAREAIHALTGRKKDIARARALASGSQPAADPALAGLQRMAGLEPPRQGTVDAVIDDLRRAAAEMENVRGTAAEDARRLAELLQQAVDHHERHQDRSTCFVCGTPGALTAEWAARTREEIGRLQDAAAHAEAAHQAGTQALAAARRLIAPVPDWLPTESPVSAAWRTWASGHEITDLAELAQHIAASGPTLIDACAAAAVEAGRQLAEREDRWRPFRGRLLSWLEQREATDAMHGKRAAVKAAYTWLKEEGADLRNMRLAPLAHEAQEVWQDLRQQSNVSLGEIRLTGSATRRAVDYAVEVDGVQAPALGVMSQGELHALALSIFLPRATVAESPFGFLVIDDPVQSMDPAKVDGLAQVLHRYARLRQVIVFTHDTRLPDAVRRLRLRATILEVVRRESSEVAVRTTDDAVTQALKDARDLTRTPGLPLDVAVPVVSGLCRTALEAAVAEVAWHRRLTDGVPHETVQNEVERAAGFYGLASLAMYGSPQRRDEDVKSRLRQHFGPAAVNVVRDCLQGVHARSIDDMRDLVRDTQRLAGDIRHAW
jgi:predicted ATPase